MKHELLVPVQTCSTLLSRSASLVWHHAPCAVVTRKAVLPGLHEAFETVTGGSTPPARKAWHNATQLKQKRPLRQRLCRFAFREFLRSCDLSPRMLHLEAFAPWQVALGAGVLGAILAAVLA